MLFATILDMDGTFVDSNDSHAQAFEKALREHGYSFSFAQIRPLIGMGGKLLLSKLLGLPEDSEVVKKIDQRHGEIFKEEFLPRVKPFPKARELVAKMKDHRLKAVVGTSANESDLKELLKIAGFQDLLDDTVSASDVEEAKPEPDIIQCALKKLGTAPLETLMLGDTPYDIEAAARAGVRTVALLCGGFSLASLKGAIAIYRDPADLWEHFEQSPFVLS